MILGGENVSDARFSRTDIRICDDPEADEAPESVLEAILRHSKTDNHCYVSNEVMERTLNFKDATCTLSVFAY
jgi:hypothetical protein